MFTAVRWRGGASGNQNEKPQLRGLGDELDAFLEEEHRRRPEVMIINKYVLVMAYIRMGMKGMGALTLLWATVVLLGGFVTDLTKKDFWYLTIIASLQAAGLFDVMGNARFVFFADWIQSLSQNIVSWAEKHHLEGSQLSMRQLPKRYIISVLVAEILNIFMIIILTPMISGPISCITLSALQVAKQDYGITNGDASKANLKAGLNLFYYLSIAYGSICMLFMIVELVGDETSLLTVSVSQQNGLSRKVLCAYLRKTKEMSLNNPASIVSWNLITYGADLLDSHLAEDYVSGGRVLTMLIDQDTPLAIRRLLIRSPRHRIHKLFGTLACRSPDEQEMRWLAARIVEHLAGDLKLAHFPGALECIASLFDTSFHNNADQEALHFCRSNPREDKYGHLIFQEGSIIIIRFCLENIWEKYRARDNGGALEQDMKQRENGEGIAGDLVLPGLKILEKLAHDSHNCKLIYNTEDLLSKIVAPVSSSTLVEDIKSNTEWTKVAARSLKVVSRLMSSSGTTGDEMRSQIADDSNAANNLEIILDMDMKSNSGIIELHMRAIEVLTQLALHHPATTFDMGRREKLIEKVLHIFINEDWMKDYLEDKKSRPSTGTLLTSLVNRVSLARAREKKMKEAQESASRLKEKAGEALAMLSSDSEAVKSFTMEVCTEDNVRCLTNLLDSSIKTIKCEIGETHVEIEINICCRISATTILKNLRNRNMKLTLEKVFAELIPIQAEASSTPQWWGRLISCSCIAAFGNDIENRCFPAFRNNTANPSNRGQDEPSASQSNHIQQCGQRRLQAELISLVAVNLENNNFDFAAILILPPRAPPVSLLEEFVVKLKKMVEDNMYATPACLAIQKLACKMVTGLLQHDGNVELIDNKNIIGSLLQASKMMARFESSMLFAGLRHDCHGVPLKPLLSVLAKQAEDLVKLKKRALALARAQVRRTNSGSAGVSTVRLARRINSASASVSPT